MAVSLGGEDPSKLGDSNLDTALPVPHYRTSILLGVSGRCQGRGRVAQASLAPSVVDVEESALTPFSENMARGATPEE